MDTGWSILNTSDNIPKSVLDDFLTVERANAAAAGKLLPDSERGGRSCMTELFCRNNLLALVRVQYQLSDNEGRPVSFAQGYLFPDAYEMLKNPNELLTVDPANFAEQQITSEEKAMLRSHTGALNHELMKKAANIPETLSFSPPLTISNALHCCGMDRERLLVWLKAVYLQLFLSKTPKSLYVITDGSQEFLQNLLYITYCSLPYSLRPLLTASTHLYKEQRNTGLLFTTTCNGAWIDPMTGENIVLDDTIGKRVENRNPIISASVNYVMDNMQDECFSGMEDYLNQAGDVRLNSLAAINLAYSMYKGDYRQQERLPVLIHQWLSLPVPNSDSWEKVAVQLMELMYDKQCQISSDTRTLLISRLSKAVTGNFKDLAKRFAEI